MISDLHIKKIDFQLPGNLTDDSVILDTVQLPVKNHLSELSETQNYAYWYAYCFSLGRMIFARRESRVRMFFSRHALKFQ